MRILMVEDLYKHSFSMVILNLEMQDADTVLQGEI